MFSFTNDDSFESKHVAVKYNCYYIDVFWLEFYNYLNFTKFHVAPNSGYEVLNENGRALVSYSLVYTDLIWGPLKSKRSCLNDG